MSMNTKNTFWDDFAAEFATLAKPNSELNYRLYYNPQTLQGKIITLDELEGVWVDFPKENVGTSSAMDWYIKDGKLEKGDSIIVVHGQNYYKEGSTNAAALLKI